MPARKNRPNKYGVGSINRREQEMLLYWFQRHRNKSLWIENDVVHGIHGFDAGCGYLVRGLVTKGYLECSITPRGLAPDYVHEAALIRYSLTKKGHEVCPNAPEGP